MKLDSKTLRLVLIGAMALLIIIFFGVALFGISVLSGKSKDIVKLKVQSQTAENQLSNLEQAKKEVQKYSYFKGVAKTVIPTDKNQAEAVLELYQMANQSGIALQSITFPNSTLGQTVAAIPGQDATTSASAQKAITQAKPVTGVSGLYSLELTITPQTDKNTPSDKVVTFDKMLKFLGLIENNRRTAQITQLDIQPAGNGQSMSFTLVIDTFIKP